MGDDAYAALGDEARAEMLGFLRHLTDDGLPAPGADLLGALPFGIYTTDADGRITFHNDAAMSLWGRRPESGTDMWCGSQRMLTVEGIPLPHADSPMAEAIRTGQPMHWSEIIIERPDGTRVPAATFPTPLFAEDGTATGAINILVELTRWKAAQAQLQESEVRFHLAATATDDVVWDHDLVKDEVRWTAALTRCFGHAPALLTTKGKWWTDHIHSGDRTRVTVSLHAAADSDTGIWVEEYRFARADGSYAHVLDRGAFVRDDTGKSIRAIGAMVDLSEKRRVDAALQLSEERFRLAASATGLGVCDYDAITGHIHWSEELRTIFGIDADVAARWDIYVGLLHPEDRRAAILQYRRSLCGDFSHGFRGIRRILRAGDGELRWIAVDGRVMRDEGERLSRVIVTARDVTDERRAQEQIAWAASHDTVTGLHNRPAFEAALRDALEIANEANPVAMLLIDLDNFKHVNDTLGHHAGDDILTDFGRRLVAVLPADTMIARFGGDEFAAILPGADAAGGAVFASAVMDSLRRPFTVEERGLDLRASIGVAASPEHGGDVSQLVQYADIALYSAKALGRSTVQTFASGMRADLQRQVSMLRQARSALENDWVQPHYQPKIDLATGRIAGFEALLRWQHPRAGLQMPDTVAAAFNDAELSGQIGGVMADAVLGDMQRWRMMGIDCGKVALNASPAEFRDGDFAQRLLEKLDRHAVAASALELEITETALLGTGVSDVLPALQALKGAGMSIALDDFGTGFSSLLHLRNFPVDVIKIDRAFVAGCGRKSDDRAIVEALLRLAEALKLVTVAEGVETQAQARFLRSHGCSLGQGFLYARAIPAAEVPAMIARFKG